MPNINVKRKLENIASEMKSLAKHATQYSGISGADHREVVRHLHEISEAADKLAAEAEKGLKDLRNRR